MDFFSMVASLGGTAAVCFLGYLWYRHEAGKREQTHAERLRALESGQPLPDADIARALAVGFIATLVPVASCGAAVGATAMVFHTTNAWMHLPMGAVIGCISGAVSIVTVVISWTAMRRRPAEEAKAREEPVRASSGRFIAAER